MAGIFAYCIHSNAYQPQVVLQILKDHAKQGFDHETDFVTDAEGKAGLGFAAPVLHVFGPCKSRDGRFLLQGFGDIFLPGGALLNQANFETNFLPAFLQSKNAFLQRLDGGFVFALYDKKEHTFTLCNDPFGNFALYYYHDERLFLCASQIHAITDVLKEQKWDEKGFHQYLGLGFALSGRTYYQGIRRLQPGELIHYHENEVRSQKYYSRYYRPDSNTRQHLVDIKDAIIASVQKRVDQYGSVGAALTGGFDSRVTWAILKALGVSQRSTAITHGLADCRDIKIARKLADHLHIPHKIKIFDKAFLETLPHLWSQFVVLSEGFGVVNGAHALGSWAFGNQLYRLLIDSHGGWLYRRQFMKVGEKRIKKDESFGRQLFRFNQSPLLNLRVLQKDILTFISRDSIEAMEQYVQSIHDNASTGDKIDLYKIHQVSANKGSTVANAQMNYVKLAHPFLNLKAFDAVQKIPIVHRRNHSIYKFIIEHTAPSLKSIWLDNTGMPVPYHGFTAFRYIPMIYELILSKSVRRVNYGLYKKWSPKKFVTDHDSFFRMHFDAIREILLRENRVFAAITDKSALERLIKQAGDHPGYALSSWANLITLKLFLDHFH